MYILTSQRNVIIQIMAPYVRETSKINVAHRYLSLYFTLKCTVQ